MDNQKKPDQFSHRAVLVGLLVLLVAMPRWLHVNSDWAGLGGAIALGALLPVFLLYCASFRKRNWSGITSLCMIPLASIGIMDIVASLREPNISMVIAAASIAVFWAALDSGRRVPN